MISTVTRFAPSPTGRLDLGHAYSALRAHDHARDRGGTFLLRIEDIDLRRSRPEYVDGIIEDLEWLGMMPDAEIVYQSERLPLYSEALDRLKEMGLAYPCFCTRSVIAAEIAASTSAPHLGAAAAAGLSDGPIYPGICRSRSMAERERRLSEERHAWRLDVAAALRALPDEALNWREGEAEVRAQPELFGDVVIARKDAPTSYHLAVTVDDAAQGITDVVRGSDLFAATHVHRLLQALLDLPTPIYHHHPLLLGPDGRRLAKRNGAPSIASLRDAGADPNGLAEDLRMGRVPYGYSPSAS